MASKIPQPQRSKIPRLNTSLGGRLTPQSRPVTPSTPHSITQGRPRVSVNVKEVSPDDTATPNPESRIQGSKEAPARLVPNVPIHDLHTDSQMEEKAVSEDDDMIEDNMSDFSFCVSDTAGESDEEPYDCVKIDKDDEGQWNLDTHFQPRRCAGVVRKAKTIFSVDLPVQGIQSGPGEDGDGCDVFPQVKSLLTKPELTELCMHPVGAGVSSVYQLSIPDSQKTAEEVLRKMEASGSCEAILPSSSILILQRTKDKSGVFRKSIEIRNSTSVVYGYKIVINASACGRFSVTPHSGLIPPHSQVTVQVKTASSCVTSMDAARDTLEVRTFPSECSDLDTLDDHCYFLKTHHPDLITTQRIERLVLWDGRDFIRMQQLLNTIQDKNEAETLKNELYSEYSERVLPEVDSKRMLHSSQLELLIAQQSLRNEYRRLIWIDDAMLVLIAFGIFSVSVLCIVPFMLTEEVVGPEAEVEPELPFWKNCYNWVASLIS